VNRRCRFAICSETFSDDLWVFYIYIDETAWQMVRHDR
jgi:hypothetical protein